MPSHFEPSRWLGKPFGNLRRARFVLVAAFAVLSAISFCHLLNWKRRAIVTGSVGPPLVTAVWGWRSYRFEAWDWQTNRSWMFPPAGDAVVANDKTLVLHLGNTIQTIDIESPGNVRRRPLPSQPSGSPWPHLVGMSADERFVVFWQISTSVGATRVPDDSTLEVFDLQTGEKADVLVAHIVTKGTLTNGLLVTEAIARGKPLTAARSTQIVRLSPEGKLIPVNQVVPQFGNRAVLSVARKQGNEFEVSGDPSAFGIYVLSVSPRGDAFVAGNWPWQSCFVGNATTIHEFPFPCSPLYFSDDASFSPDGTRVAICDARDDLHIVDIQAGQIVAQNFEGTRQRQRGRYFFAAALLLVSVWYVLLLRETAWNGSVIDVSAILLLLGFSAVAFPHVFGIDYGMAYLVNWLGPGLEFFTTLYLPLALIAACGVAVAWYWVFGTGAMLGRWLRGVLWLLVMATPSVISFSLRHGPGYYPWPPDWLAAASLGVVVAGAMTAALSAIRLSSWTIAKSPVAAQPRQFDLRTMMAVMAGMAVVFASSRVLLSIDPQVSGTVRQWWSFLLGPLLIAVLLPAILLSSYSRRTRISLVVMIGVATLLWTIRWPFLARLTPMADNYMLWEQSFLVMLVLVLGLSCKIARRDGWRWVRVGAAEAVTEMHPVQPAS